MRRLAVCVLLTATLASCRPGTVAISFHPKVGTVYRYEVRVKATTTTTLQGSASKHKVENVHLIAEHTILTSGPKGVRVRIRVGEPGNLAQTFVVRFDRSAQLQSIESVEGAPEEIVGALGVPEIFPGAAGPPPGRHLAPGDRWAVDRSVTVPGAAGPSRLHVSGRLVELGLDGREEIAELTSTTALPVETTATSAAGMVGIVETQRIRQRTTYDLGDGAVRRASATTTGHFDIRAEPPAGTTAAAVPGTLEVRVTSSTRRLP